MDAPLAHLLKNHKVEKGKEYYNIYLNIPDEFIYSVSNILVRWFPETNLKTVICSEIPENIKQNIYKFNYLEIGKFINFFEDNLLVFFMGKVPQHEIEEQEVLEEGELSKNFKFPVHNNVNGNVKLDISTVNILLFCCQRISIVVKCLKCQDITSLTGTRNCKRCGYEIGLVYVPCIQSTRLGYLQPKKSEFICFNPQIYQFTCEECGKAYESSEVGIGQNFTKKCMGCYKEMRFKVNVLEYYAQKEVKLVEGGELPEKGACKHYKKSFRWFRFNCCNNVYPCDGCHNEQEGHKAEMANRMICGLCSKEQSVKPSCNCGMDLEKKKSQFWEGGKGNRDKQTLNRRDSKKYK